MKQQLSYTIRPKKPEEEKKRILNQENKVPSFNLDDFKRYPGKETPQKPKKLIKKLGVIGGGVTVGLIFGYALLQTFINPTDMNPAGQVTQPMKSTVVSTNVKQMSISLTEINVYLVQAGVFTSQESANKKASEFKNKQQPAEVIQEDGKYIVYIGIASSRDEALSIAQFYRSENIPVMIKEKQIPTGSVSLQVPAATSQETISQLNTMSASEAELFKLLTVNASSSFSQTKTPIPANEKVTALYETLLKQGNTLSDLLQDPGKTDLQNSLNELSGAVKAANTNQLLQLQSNLLRFYNKEKDFRSGGHS